MTQITLLRVAHYSHATLGILSFDTHNLFTLERPWMNNQPRISCIPPGTYRLEPHHSRRFPDHYALIGGTVSHYPDADHVRSAILMHAANKASQLQGCIAPGYKANFEPQPFQVERSRAALGALHNWIREQEVSEIRIVRGTV